MKFNTEIAEQPKRTRRLSKSKTVEDLLIRMKKKKPQRAFILKLSELLQDSKKEVKFYIFNPCVFKKSSFV